MAKSESVDNHCLMARANFIVLSSTHNWVDGVKFIAWATIPDILPFFQTELGDVRNKIICWEFHFCNGKGQSRFSCSVGFLVAWDVHMTWDPTKDDRFPIVGEMCILKRRLSGSISEMEQVR